MPRYTIRDPQSGRSFTLVGDSPPTEAEITKAFLDMANATPLAEPSTYDAGFRKGALEGVLGGMQGFAQGVAQAPGDLWKTVKQVAAHPIDSAAAVIDSVNPVKLAGRLPVMLRDTAARMEASRTDPQGWGRPIGSQVGQLVLTAAPEILPGMVGAAGRGIEAAGKSPIVNRASTYAAIGSGVSGNVGAAAAAAAVPPALRAVGRGTQAVGRGLRAGTDAVKAGAGRILESRGVPVPSFTRTPPAPRPVRGLLREGGPIITPPPRERLALPPAREPIAGPPSPSSVAGAEVQSQMASEMGAMRAEDLAWLERRLQPLRQMAEPSPQAAALDQAIVSELGGSPAGRPPQPSPATAQVPSSTAPAAPGAAPAAPLPTPQPLVAAPPPVAPAPESPVSGVTLGLTETGEPIRGFPQILNWKGGAQPSPSAAQAYRSEMGVKDAAAALRVPKRLIEQLAPRDPNTPVQLPRRARARIDAKTKGMTAEQGAAYKAQAPHDLAAQYVQDALQRALQGLE